jgi:hypothetical protein
MSSAMLALGAFAGCGLVSVPSSQAAVPRVRSSLDASALLNRAFADARAKGSFHQVLTQVAGKLHGMLENDVSLDSGRQLLTSSDGSRAKVEVVGHTVYMLGNQRALKFNFNFTSQQVAVIGTNWVSVPSSDSAFASFAYDVTVSTALDEVSPSGHLTESPARTIDGQRLIAISGGVPSGFSGGATSRATLYVTADSDPLPVRAVIETSLANANKTRLTLTGTLSDWGERVAVTPPKGLELSTAQVTLLAQQLSPFAITGEPGYFAVAGKQSRAVALGRPWGVACQPIRFAVEASVPDWAYSQIAAVVAQARQQGIDVVLESRGGAWKHSALYYRDGQSAASSKQVTIVAGAGTGTTSVPMNQQAMQLSTDSRADRDGHKDDLSSITAAFHMQVVNHSTATVRRSIRQLIAWTQGISETTDPVSGITQRSFTDSFTKSDLSAMLAMSGCEAGSSGTTTVTGIAA